MELSAKDEKGRAEVVGNVKAKGMFSHAGWAAGKVPGKVTIEGERSLKASTLASNNIEAIFPSLVYPWSHFDGGRRRFSD